MESEMFKVHVSVSILPSPFSFIHGKRARGEEEERKALLSDEGGEWRGVKRVDASHGFGR